jgi:hypothetical protein
MIALRARERLAQMPDTRIELLRMSRAVEIECHIAFACRPHAQQTLGHREIDPILAHRGEDPTLLAARLEACGFFGTGEYEDGLEGLHGEEGAEDCGRRHFGGGGGVQGTRLEGG